MFSDQQILTLAALSLSITIFMYAVILRRRNRKHASLLAEQSEELHSLKAELAEKEENKEQEFNFEKSLKQAEVTTGLQQTRISFHNETNKSKAPERYAYVLSMFRSGIPTEEISSALGMSSYEITQLLKLSALAQKTEQTTG